MEVLSEENGDKNCQIFPIELRADISLAYIRDSNRQQKKRTRTVY